MRSFKQLFRITTLTFAAASALMVTTAAQASNKYYEVTVTNITQGVVFTPIMVASHKHGVKLFELGGSASNGLEHIAESGNTVPLSDELIATGKTLDIATADGVLFPGDSLTLTVKTDKRHSHVSVASMLVPTNDAFFAVNGLHGPRGKRSKTVYSPAYDAGTENNDELCANIPGPPFACTGEGYNSEGGEGFVHIHPGIHGNGDLSEDSYDWRNPVAKITIRRIKD